MSYCVCTATFGLGLAYGARIWRGRQASLAASGTPAPGKECSDHAMHWCVHDQAPGPRRMRSLPTGLGPGEETRHGASPCGVCGEVTVAQRPWGLTLPPRHHGRPLFYAHQLEEGSDKRAVVVPAHLGSDLASAVIRVRSSCFGDKRVQGALREREEISIYMSGEVR